MDQKRETFVFISEIETNSLWVYQQKLFTIYIGWCPQLGQKKKNVPDKFQKQTLPVVSVICHKQNVPKYINRKGGV